MYQHKPEATIFFFVCLSAFRLIYLSNDADYVIVNVVVRAVRYDPIDDFTYGTEELLPVYSNDARESEARDFFPWFSKRKNALQNWSYELPWCLFFKGLT